MTAASSRVNHLRRVDCPRTRGRNRPISGNSWVHLDYTDERRDRVVYRSLRLEERRSEEPLKNFRETILPRRRSGQTEQHPGAYLR